MAEIILKNITKEYENGFLAVKNVNLAPIRNRIMPLKVKFFM